MNDNKFNPEPGTQTDYQPSQDTRREYENPAGDNSTIIDDNERATPQEFPERSQQHEYKDPSGNQAENNEEDQAEDVEDEVDTDGEIFNQDNEDKTTDPVDEQSLDKDDPDSRG